MKFFTVFSLFTLGLTGPFTQVSWAQASGQPAPADPTSFIFLMIAMVAIMYFIVIRPQQKEQKEHQKRINALKKGDKVVTAGGVHGVVRTVKEKTLVVEIAPNIKITLNRQSVSSVLEGENGKGKKSQSKDEPDESDEDEDLDE
ncbi:MAG: preprotein translocase subunit YajC [Candidatus Omnitrophica bacterium]|nr:preprotein translocase subunit YajC [Candidatus Omnitrophota bacterium]